MGLLSNVETRWSFSQSAVCICVLQSVKRRPNQQKNGTHQKCTHTNTHMHARSTHTHHLFGFVSFTEFLVALFRSPPLNIMIEGKNSVMATNVWILSLSLFYLAECFLPHSFDFSSLCTKRSASASVNEPRRRKRRMQWATIAACDASERNRRSVTRRCVRVYCVRARDGARVCVCVCVRVGVLCMLCVVPRDLLLFLFRFYYMAISSCWRFDWFSRRLGWLHCIRAWSLFELYVGLVGGGPNSCHIFR